MPRSLSAFRSAVYDGMTTLATPCMLARAQSRASLFLYRTMEPLSCDDGRGPRPPDYCALSPAALMSFACLATSSRTKLPSSAGVLPTSSEPSCCR